MGTTVAVIGGGYGGVRAARMLDGVADVVLIEPRDAFVHNVAALRGLTDPEWTDQVFIPYDRLLARGRVVRDRAVHVEPGAVTLASGERIDAGYIVLATGSTYPFPAKTDLDDSSATKERFHATRAELAPAEHAVVFGAGAVGLELAAEIKEAWPDKRVTLIDPGPDVLGGEYSAELRGELRRQLDGLGIALLLGDAVPARPARPPGVRGPFALTTGSGAHVAGDIWFRCYGPAPVTGYLADSLASTLRPDGRLSVTPHLRLPGHETVFAIGDITAVPEPKQGAAADAHGRVAAANIAALIRGDGPLAAYEPEEPAILVPLGSAGGASQLPGEVVGAATTSDYKGKNLLVDDYRDVLDPGIEEAVATGAADGWIAANAHPLTTTDADADLGDIAPLRALVGDASVVGLGMSTRASHEMMAIGHRAVRLLAEEAGFRVLAFHEDEELVAELDAYVRTGEGDPRAALSEMFLTWRTREWLGVVEWARRFNAAGPAWPIRFIGLSSSAARRADYAAVIDHAARVDPAAAEELRRHYGVIATAHDRPEHVQLARGTHPGRRFAEHARDAYDLVASLPAADGGVAATDRAARILDLHTRSFTEGFDYGAVRRRAVSALGSLVAGGDRVVYWDGLAFTANADPLEPHSLLDPLRTVGSGLRARLGSRYVSLLLSFSHGDLGEVHFGQVAPPPAPGTVGAVLALAGPERYLLDLRAPAPGPVGEWLRRPHRLRTIGGVYDPASDSDHYLTTGALDSWFDAVLHTGPVTPTRLL